MLAKDDLCPECGRPTLTAPLPCEACQEMMDAMNEESAQEEALREKREDKRRDMLEATRMRDL